MKTSPLISIIIVNYNGQRWLADCFNSIFKQKIDPLEVIFVDNHSTDESLKIVREKYPLVKIIKNKHNLGFGRANNLGAKKAQGKFLLFLNTDTKLHPGCLKEMVRQMSAKKIDLAGPKLFDFDHRDFYHNRKLTLDIVGSLSWGKQTTMIEGCCLMIKKTVFDHLGGFDESFFMYSEDLDLCWRAWLQGYRTRLVRTAAIDHYGGGSSLPTMIGSQRHQVPAFRRFETEKNTIRMMLKNASLFHLILALPLMFILVVAESFLYLLTGQLSAAGYLLKAFRWNWDHLKETWALRTLLRKTQTRPDLWPLLAKKITKFEVFRLIGIPKIKV